MGNGNGNGNAEKNVAYSGIIKFIAFYLQQHGS